MTAAVPVVTWAQHTCLAVNLGSARSFQDATSEQRTETVNLTQNHPEGKACPQMQTFSKTHVRSLLVLSLSPQQEKHYFEARRTGLDPT